MTAPLAEPPLRFLSPENRLPKVSLWRRVEECARQIREASTGLPFDVEAFCRAANRGALAMAMAGDMEESERSCRRQAQILLALIRAGSVSGEELPRVLQPWINIGRLRVIQGRWEEALAHFPSPASLHGSRAFGGWPDEDAGPTRNEVDLILGSTAGAAFVTDTHVVETAKAYARGRRADLLAAHVERWRDSAGHLPHLREAEALLALRNGCPIPPLPEGGPLSLGAAAIKVHAAAADPDRVESLIDSLDLLGTHPGSADLVTVVLAGAKVMAGHGRVDEACRFLNRVVDVCRDLGDEAELFAALTVLGRLDPDSGAAEEARGVAADSGYSFIRAATGQKPLRPVADEPRLELLRSSEIDVQSKVVPSLEAR
ncbi:hypothetical protein [Nocardiopsis changdeensis]|uniref:hypothetical protein n=1 Tax=Nocardiopsis changdeensis TaxID=2831969 RepID=UPI003F4751CD